MSGVKLDFKQWLAGQADAGKQAEARKRMVEAWAGDLGELFTRLVGWLAEDDTERVLNVLSGKIRCREEDLGQYDAPTLTVFLHGRGVDLVPVARHVVGGIGTRGDPGIRAEGRVDMTNGADRYFLYRAVYPDGPRWVIVDDEQYAVRPLDKEAFEAALQDLLS